MNRNLLAAATILYLTLTPCSLLASDPPPSGKRFPELNQLRKTAWEGGVLTMVARLEEADPARFPGIHAWLKDFHVAAQGIDVKVKANKWPTIDVDTLVTHNPSFWDAYYSIAPGDPGLIMLHASLLIAAGETTRGSYGLVLSSQRPEISPELQRIFGSLFFMSRKAREQPDALVQEGIQLHDRGNYDGALKKYHKALALWPQHGLAYYEIGQTYFQRSLAAMADGKEVVTPESLFSPEMDVMYTEARRLDPFLFMAYQGKDPAVKSGLKIMVSQAIPAWKKVQEGFVDDEVLVELADALQEANVHDLALVTRQILVARRKSYDPSDHPFITTSLRKLAPGQQTEDGLQRLAGEYLVLYALVALQPAAP